MRTSVYNVGLKRSVVHILPVCHCVAFSTDGNQARLQEVTDTDVMIPKR